MNERITIQLLRQLQFLDRSCKLFDLGYLEEAVRIATCIRVLLHDRPWEGPDRGSILKHLGAMDIRLRTTCRRLEEGTTPFVFDGYVHVPGNILPWDEYLRRDVVQLDVSSWLSQVIFVSGGHIIRRQDLILAAANKDGGAHVDPKLTAEYQAAVSIWTMSTPDGAGASLDQNHLWALRRFGLEVLNSQDLLTLAGIDSPRALDSSILVRASEDELPVMLRAADVSVLRGRGDALAQAGEHLQAEQAYGRGVRLLDEIAVALLVGRGNALVRLGEYQVAVSAFEDALGRESTNASARYGLGFALKASGEVSRAEAVLREGATLHPEHIPIKMTLADLEYRRRDYQAAIHLYDRVLSLDPSHGVATNNRTAASEALGQQTVPISDQQGDPPAP